MLARDAKPDTPICEIRDLFTSALLRILTATPVLRILSELQRSLDVLDIEGLSRLWRRTERTAPLYRTTFASFFEHTKGDGVEKPPSTPLGVSSLFLSEPQPDIEDWEEFLDTYLSPFRDGLDNSKPAPENLRYYLLAYLLSATFKDCSLIARLDFLKPGVEQEVKVGPQTVTVIDLDPKSMEKLRGWEKLDKEIATFYSTNTEKKTCVDAFAS
jgi:inositol-pentakisphosphate 2-kinase